MIASCSTSDNRYWVHCKESSYPSCKLPGPLACRLLLWCLVWLVFPLSGSTTLLSFRLEVLGRDVPYHAVSPAPVPTVTELSKRVLLHLERSEVKEIDPWLRDDIRISWITVLYASRGNSQPHVDATYRVLGLHPERVWTAILARRAAILGSDDFARSLAPKKPCAHVGRKKAA